MSVWNTNNTVYITVIQGHAKDSITEKGIKVFSPYYGDDLPLRLLRELCFCIPFLPKTVWYKKDVLKERPKFINIIDVNITSHYLKWIKSYFSDSQINFIYDNMVGRARNISPDRIPEGIRIWTYDDYDSRKYRIRLTNNYWVSEDIFKEKAQPVYDVFFIGRDKGRGKELCKLEKQFQNLGLTTKFIITKDKRFSLNKPYYQKPISYKQVLEYDAKSRSVLNVVMDNQEGVTLRDMEALVIGTKLITTNKHIVNKDLYNKNNVFILGVDKIEELPEFLKSEYVNVWDDIKNNHSFEAMMDEITQ